MRGTALLVTAATLVLAAGCSAGGSGAAASPTVEKPDLVVAVVPALDSAGFFVAYYEGLFKAEGLHITPKFITSSETAIAEQEAGTYDTSRPAITFPTSRPSRTGTPDSGPARPIPASSPPTWTSSPKDR